MHDALIADHAGAALGGGRVNAAHVHACLGPCDEEGPGLMDRVEAREVLVATIHHVEGTWLEGQHVQHMNVVELAVADVDEGGNAAPQVQQGVQLDGRFGLAKRCPLEQAQAQIDGGRIQAVDSVVELEPDGLCCVKLAPNL